MLDCAPNFRDLGLLQTTDGLQVIPGRLFRSEAILGAGPADIDRLKSLDLGLVLDVRSAFEAQEFPNHVLMEIGADIRQLDVGTDVKAKGTFWEVLSQDCSPRAVETLIHKIYRSIPVAVVPALKVYFGHVTEAPAPTLIHCTAGKDRTGVAVALLLDALDVAQPSIFDDYLATQRTISDEVIERGARNFAEVAGKTLPDESIRMLSGVRRDFLEQSYAWIERKHGSARNFLQVHAGLSEAKREDLRRALLEPSNTSAKGM